MVENTNTTKMQARGKAVAAVPKFIIKNFGKKEYEKWLEVLSGVAHNIYALSIDNDEWYPLKETIIEPCANIAQLFYSWDLKKAAWELGRFSADNAIGGVSRFFGKKSNAGAFLNKVKEYMSEYYRPVTVEVIDEGDTAALLKVTQFPEMENTMKYRIAGWVERALEITGCKEVQVEITSSPGSTDFKLSWK